MAYSLSSAEIIEFEGMFKRLDKDNSGTIGMQEFLQVMNDNLVISSQEMKRMFNMVDSNGKGEISYSEFVASLLQSRISMHQYLLREAFDRFDTEKKGKITTDDMRHLLGEGGFDGVGVDDLLSAELGSIGE